jgi:hypothetical protein
MHLARAQVSGPRHMPSQHLLGIPVCSQCRSQCVRRRRSPCHSVSQREPVSSCQLCQLFRQWCRQSRQLCQCCNRCRSHVRNSCCSRVCSQCCSQVGSQCGRQRCTQCRSQCYNQGCRQSCSQYRSPLRSSCCSRMCSQCCSQGCSQCCGPRGTHRHQASRQWNTPVAHVIDVQPYWPAALKTMAHGLSDRHNHRNTRDQGVRR